MSKQNRQRGYHERLFLVAGTTPPPEFCRCSICKDFIRDPYRCADEHPFCKKCIDPQIKPGNTFKCPVDNKSFKILDLKPFRAACSIMDNMKICCPTTMSVEVNEGNIAVATCDWVGEIRMEKDHNLTCPFLIVSCPHVSKGCNIRDILRGKLSDHESICDYREVPCKWCTNHFRSSQISQHEDKCYYRKYPCLNNGCLENYTRDNKYYHESSCIHRVVACRWCQFDVVYKDLDTHYSICDQVPIPCRNQCSVSYTKLSMETHLKVCQNEPIECPLKTMLGCCAVIARAQMPAHAADMKSHFTLLVQKLDASVLSKEHIDCLNVEIASLKQTVQELSDKLDNLQQKIEAKNCHCCDNNTSANNESLKDPPESLNPVIEDKAVQLVLGVGNENESADSSGDDCA